MNSEKLELLKKAEIEFAFFSRDDGKFNIVYLKTAEEKVNFVLKDENSSAEKGIISETQKSENIQQSYVSEKSETEKQRNSRLNAKIKTQSALNGAKPCYKVMNAEQLEILKKVEIEFAFFSRDDGKFNVVYLKEADSNVNFVLKGKGSLEGKRNAANENTH